MSSSLLKIYHGSRRTVDSRIRHIYEGLPLPVFRWILLGPSGSGKSTLIKNILFNRDLGYSRYFDEIYVWLGSLDDIEEMREIVSKSVNLKDKIRILNKFDNDDVQELFDNIEQDNVSLDKPQNVLFVFDDQVTNGISKISGKTNVLDTIFVRGRHANVSCIVSTQKYKLLNQNMRQLNATHLTVYYGTERTDLDGVASEHAGTLDSDDLLRLLKRTLTRRYDSITIDKKADANKRFKDKEFDTIDVSESESFKTL